MEPTKRRTLPAVIALVWFVVITAPYYVTHKPFDPALAVQAVIVLWRFLIVALILSAAGGVGRKLVRLETAHPLTEAAVQAALGLGTYSILILAVGSFLGLSALILWGILGLSIVLLWKDVFAWWRGWASVSKAWLTADRFSRLLAVYLLIVLGLTLLAASAPPVKFDALVYHLTMPKAYLAEGRITYLPWLMMTGMPQTAEMLYTWAAGLGGGMIAAPILGWTFGLLAVMGLYGFVNTYLGDRAAWIATACLLSGYSLVASLAWGYVEWLTLLFGLAVLVLIDRWSASGKWRHLILAGVFAGLALGTKVPAGFLALISLPIAFWQARRCGRNPVISVGIFGAAVILASLPWWIKNLITTGNPFYPLLFASGAMTEARLKVFQNAPTWGNLTDLLLLPIRATYMGIEGGDGYNFSIGPLLLGLVVFAGAGLKAAGDRAGNVLRMAAAFTLLGMIVWAVGNQFSGFLIQTRMYLAIFPAVCVLAAAGYCALSSKSLPGIRINRIVNAMLVLVLGLNLIEVASHTVALGPLQNVFGVQSSDEYLKQNLGSYAVAMAAIRDLPDSDSVLLLVEPRSLYCYPKCRPDETLDRWPRDYGRYHEPERILQAWKEEGFTHVLYYKRGAEFLRENKDVNHTEEQWQALDAFLQGLPIPVDFNGVYELYALTE